MKLFILLLGCKPPGRLTEQHDIFFGIGDQLKDLAPAIFNSWPEANRRLHIDAWREVNSVDGYRVSIVPRAGTVDKAHARLFFINLGGYKPGEFEEFHYKMVVAAPDKGVAVQRAKQTVFYKHTGFAGATSHIDDKYGVDVDDMYEIEDILPAEFKAQYRIILEPADEIIEDTLQLGYLKMEKLENS